ncbi:hypothetical protein HMPREF1583_00163 [Gardnerella vaginalis JCP8151B]|nr:hypothetical protein HMPREF1583_00163 [Gardnerella vaginalis JCP8151B]
MFFVTRVSQKPQHLVVWVRANHKRMQIVRLNPVPERKHTT